MDKMTVSKLTALFEAACQGRVDRAVAAEREACAQVADHHCGKAGELIAAEIRGRAYND